MGFLSFLGPEFQQYEKQKELKKLEGGGPPDISGLQRQSKDRVAALQARFNEINVPGERLKAENMPGFTGPSAPLEQFNVARDRAKQSAGAAAVQGGDAINRRFAAMGNLNSGAALKAAENVRNEAAAQEQNALAQINAQEQAVRFDVDQANLNRDLQRQENVAQRNFQRDLKNLDQAFQEKVFSFDSQSKLAQLDIGLNESMIKNTLEQDAQEFNKRMEGYKAKNSGGLLGGGGLLGTGIGF